MKEKQDDVLFYGAEKALSFFSYLVMSVVSFLGSVSAFSNVYMHADFHITPDYSRYLGLFKCGLLSFHSLCMHIILNISLVSVRR